jgi:hypothetical protein
MKKKKMFISFMALVVLFAFAQMAMAYTVKLVGGSGYGPYQTGSGGEFTLQPDVTLQWVLNSYSTLAKNQYQAQGSTPNFQTFCVEDYEYVYANGTYTAILNTAAVLGNVGPGGDPISVGTAYLYFHFVKGDLTGYDYINPGRSGDISSSAYLLQQAIWWLEGEGGSQNSFTTLVGGAAGKVDNNGTYPVFALNLWEPGHEGDFSKDIYGNYLWVRQDMLVVATPIPAAAWLLGSGLVGLVAIRRRMKK